jgi:hypothetical protein
VALRIHTARLKPSDLETSMIQAVFEGNMVGLNTDLLLLKQQSKQSKSDFQQNLLVVFWFAVHLESLEIVQQLWNQEAFLRKIVNALSIRYYSTKKSSMSQN